MDLITFQQIVLDTLTHDFLRYALGAGIVYVLINVALAGPLQARKIRTQSPGWDQMAREIAVSMRTVLIFAANGIAISVGAVLEILPIYTDLETYGWPWFIASIAVIVVAHDAWFYWTHRMMHHPALFRVFHRLHHRSHNPTPFTSYSFDTGEAIVNAIFLPLFVALIPMHPAALLIFVFHMMIRNALGHCGYEVFPADLQGRPIFRWLAGVTHHDQHHANARYNLGFYFTWWDRIMGTEHPEYLSEFARVAPRLPFDKRDVTAALLLGLIMLTAAASQTRAADRDSAVNGIYAAPGLWAVVRFAPCSEATERTCGNLLWGWDMADWRGFAPGDRIIEGKADTSRGHFQGRLTDPYSGRVYRGTIRQRADGTLLLKGCVGPFCQSQIWHPLPRIRQRLARLG